VLQGQSHSSPAGPDALSLSAQYRYILRQAPSTHVTIVVPLSKLLDLNRQDHQHYILEQAATELDVPLPILLDLSNRQRRPHKRPRLNTGIPMSTPYSDDPVAQDGHEKSPLTGQPSHSGNAARKPFNVFSDSAFPPRWAGARIADCLNFTVCGPCSTTYEPQPGMFTPRRGHTAECQLT
jgi:hypothetical protein